MGPHKEEQNTFCLGAENIEECLIGRWVLASKEKKFGNLSKTLVGDKNDSTFIKTVFPGLAHTTLVCTAPINLLQK